MASSEDDKEGPSPILFDADFIKGAGRRELSADERHRHAERAKAEAERLASIRRRDQRNHQLHRRAARAIRRHRPRSAVTAVVLVALVAYAAIWAPNRRQSLLWASGPPITQEIAAGTERPTARPADSAVPLRRPTAATVPGTTYAFMAVQPRSSVPVTYDPCRPIAVVVNPRSAPPAGAKLVDEALAQLGVQAGFVFRYEGLVTEPPVEQRLPFQPQAYGDRWAPVLIAWSDPAESPRLSGSVAGMGGSTSLPVSGSQLVYVTGSVILDGPAFAQILSGEDGMDQARAIILHELGHLIGLAHVSDSSELMHDKSEGGVTNLGPGDLSGIAALRSSARCQPTL